MIEIFSLQTPERQSSRIIVGNLKVLPVPKTVAGELIVRHHYLRSLPGGTKLAFGVFINSSLQGALTLGVGPKNAHCLVEGATSDDCLTLTRLWLSDGLPHNSESRVIGLVIKSLRHYTAVKFLLSYADPAQGHLGIIYQATNWLYTGLSSAMSLYDLGDGVARHSRSVGQIFGSHSINHLAQHGIAVKLVPQAAKHRYVYFFDPSWRNRLRVQILPYPKKENSNESN